MKWATRPAEDYGLKRGEVPVLALTAENDADRALLKWLYDAGLGRPIQALKNLAVAMRPNGEGG